jgi:hypothetical protein
MAKEVCAGGCAPRDERPTRAALLLAGMTAVAGCSLEHQAVPAYGAPPVRDAGADDADSGGAVDSGAASDSQASDVDSGSGGD